MAFQNRSFQAAQWESYESIFYRAADSVNFARPTRVTTNAHGAAPPQPNRPPPRRRPRKSQYAESRTRRSTRTRTKIFAAGDDFELLLPDQAPASRKSRAVSAVDENVVVEIPDRGLSRPSIVKHIVWLSVSVKVGCRHERPATGNVRPISAPNER
jgi:hypothetical protein